MKQPNKKLKYKMHVFVFFGPQDIQRTLLFKNKYIISINGSNLSVKIIDNAIAFFILFYLFIYLDNFVY